MIGASGREGPRTGPGPAAGPDTGTDVSLPDLPDRLDAALLAAHERGDRHALVGLYATAATGAEGVARAFFLTQAYVFALEVGDPRAGALKTALVDAGADRP